MVNQLAPVRLLDATVDSGAELRILFNQAQSGILNQMLGISTGMVGYLGKLGFLLRSEMDFHAPTVSFAGLCQHLAGLTDMLFGFLKAGRSLH